MSVCAVLVYASSRGKKCWTCCYVSCGGFTNGCLQWFIKWHLLNFLCLRNIKGVSHSGWWPQVLNLAHVQHRGPVKTNTSFLLYFSFFPLNSVQLSSAYRTLWMVSLLQTQTTGCQLKKHDNLVFFLIYVSTLHEYNTSSKIPTSKASATPSLHEASVTCLFWRVRPSGDVK